MIEHITAPVIVEAAGVVPKLIEEFVGRVSSIDDALSIARMRSPHGWSEPGQTPEFDEFSLVLAGQLQVETRDATLQILAGQAVKVPRGNWVRYSTPHEGGAEYLAVCTPAFSPTSVHRDIEQ